jgi:hypothetical protein
VPDPDGGPPWGVRLVKTTRGETCIQVGRVVNGQIGALGIDGAWKDDHEFHEIKPNDQLADICGATDAAGHGFANEAAHGAPASVDVPLFNSSGGPGRCRSPYEPSLLSSFPTHAKLPPAFKRRLKFIQQRRDESPACPASAMRMVFAGLLGPLAKSITYKTPGGRAELEQTSGGVGAYLIVFRETRSNCNDFTRTLMSESEGCDSSGNGGTADLQGPTAVTRVAYENGKTCSLQPSPSFARAYISFERSQRRSESAKRAQQQFAKFLAAHHLNRRDWFQAVVPACEPVGWVPPQEKKLTPADVASPIRLRLREGTRFCNRGPFATSKTIPCDGRVPPGYRSFYETRPAKKQLLVTISFVARLPVRSDNSRYVMELANPGNGGGQGNGTDANVRQGQRITFNDFVSPDVHGVYRGILAFTQNSGRGGQRPAISMLRHGSASLASGTIVIGRFSFRLPLSH